MKKRQELYEALRADFPEEAYSADRSRGHVLTSLKAQYITERLNEVFGLGNWSLSGEWQEVDDGVLYLGKLKQTRDVPLILLTRYGRYFAI